MCTYAYSVLVAYVCTYVCTYFYAASATMWFPFLFDNSWEWDNVRHMSLCILWWWLVADGYTYTYIHTYMRTSCHTKSRQAKTCTSLQSDCTKTTQMHPNTPRCTQMQIPTRCKVLSLQYIRTSLCVYKTFIIRTYVHTYVRTYVCTYVRTYVWCSCTIYCKYKFV